MASPESCESVDIDHKLGLEGDVSDSPEQGDSPSLQPPLDEEADEVEEGEEEVVSEERGDLEEEEVAADDPDENEEEEVEEEQKMSRKRKLDHETPVLASKRARSFPVASPPSSRNHVVEMEVEDGEDAEEEAIENNEENVNEEEDVNAEEEEEGEEEAMAEAEEDTGAMQNEEEEDGEEEEGTPGSSSSSSETPVSSAPKRGANDVPTPIIQRNASAQTLDNHKATGGAMPTCTPKDKKGCAGCPETLHLAAWSFSGSFKEAIGARRTLERRAADERMKAAKAAVARGHPLTADEKQQVEARVAEDCKSVEAEEGWRAEFKRQCEAEDAVRFGLTSNELDTTALSDEQIVTMMLRPVHGPSSTKLALRARLRQWIKQTSVGGRHCPSGTSLWWSTVSLEDSMECPRSPIVTSDCKLRSNRLKMLCDKRR